MEFPTASRERNGEALIPPMDIEFTEEEMDYIIKAVQRVPAGCRMPSETNLMLKLRKSEPGEPITIEGWENYWIQARCEKRRSKVTSGLLEKLR